MLPPPEVLGKIAAVQMIGCPISSSQLLLHQSLGSFYILCVHCPVSGIHEMPLVNDHGVCKGSIVESVEMGVRSPAI